MSFEILFEFESQLAEYTGAPYAIVTDCCTHAIELCLRHERPPNLAFTAYTYLSIPMLMHKLGIEYRLIPEEWCGEYQFHGSRVWDSARRLEQGMYKSGQMQCLSFGHSKPLQLGRAGAILLDDSDAYHAISRMRSDGRDLHIAPWQEQKTFQVGYHYCPSLEICRQGLDRLKTFAGSSQIAIYPDCRDISIK